MTATVVVVGAGLAGIAAARALSAAGIAVRVLDRGRRIGGRMGARTLDGRAVDTGASYLTVPDGSDASADPAAAAAADAFAGVVADWRRRGIAREWTDTFATADADRLTGTKPGPMRWGAPGGLRSLVEDLAAALPDVVHPVDVAAVRRDGAATGDDGTPDGRTPDGRTPDGSAATVDRGGQLTVDGDPASAVVLAMPDAQARRLLTGPDGAPAPGLADVTCALTRESEPQVAVAAGWETRGWADFAGAFVNGSDTLSWIADDGSRHGDGAPVLVAHATPQLSAAHLADPDALIAPVLAEVRRILSIGAPPRWSIAQRWGLAKAVGRRDDPYLLTNPAAGAPVAVCGDGWGGPSRVAQAFASGHRAGQALACRLVQP